MTNWAPVGLIVGGNPVKRLTDFVSCCAKILNECVVTLDVEMTLDHRKDLEALVDENSNLISKSLQGIGSLRCLISLVMQVGTMVSVLC